MPDFRGVRRGKGGEMEEAEGVISEGTEDTRM